MDINEKLSIYKREFLNLIGVRVNIRNANKKGASTK